MSLVDDLRGVFDALDNIPVDLGARDFTVTIRVEQFDDDIQDGAALEGAAVPDLVLTPPPAVERVQLADPSWFAGDDRLAGTGAEPRLAIYRISANRAYAAGAGGGYTPDQLAPRPTQGTRQRVVYVLTGPGLNDGGEKFALVDAKFDGLYEYELVVARAPGFD